MSINYKKELESAAKTMILVHDPDTLIRIIVRAILQKVKIAHAGILLYDKPKNSYILTVSRGPRGLKIPAGFAKVGTDNPLIRFFRKRKNRILFDHDAIIYDEAKAALQENPPAELKEPLSQVLYHMETFETVACIPSYFASSLLGILLLGEKLDKTPFNKEEIDFFIALASDVAMAIRNAQLFNELQSELENRRKLFLHTTVALATAIDAKDHYTHGHTARVTTICLALARKVFQITKKQTDEKFMEQLHIGALLHDIGKIGIPEAILNKTGPLTAEEREKINEHSTMGVTILQPIRELGDSLLGVKYHHERYDGAGYPEGLKGEDIPFIAAIISLADTFDAMTSDRPYRKQRPKEEAVNEIMSLSGKQFNPLVCQAFFELHKEGAI